MTPPTIDQLRNLVNRAGDGGLTPAEADRLREGFELLVAAALPDAAPDGPRAAVAVPNDPRWPQNGPEWPPEGRSVKEGNRVTEDGSQAVQAPLKGFGRAS